MLTIQEKIELHFEQHFRAIQLCLDNVLINSALILIYSVIDNISWLARESNQTGEYFTKWVDKYLIPNSDLKCSAIDFYAARCGMVHASKAESTLSIKGKAKQIFYSFGKTDVRVLQKAIKAIGQENEVKAIHINNLFDALKLSKNRYFRYLKNNDIQRALFEKEFRKVMGRMDQGIYKSLNKIFENPKKR